MLNFNDDQPYTCPHCEDQTMLAILFVCCEEAERGFLKMIERVALGPHYVVIPLTEEERRKIDA